MEQLTVSKESISLQILKALLCHSWCLSIFQVSCMLRLVVHMYTCYGRDQLLRVWKQQACSIFVLKEMTHAHTNIFPQFFRSRAQLKTWLLRKRESDVKTGRDGREVIPDQVYWEELIYNYNKENSFLYKITLTTLWS